MAQNPESLAKQKAEKVDYDWGTLWPHYHKEKMNWATGFRTKGDVDILFLSGSTGRDPFEDAPCRTPDQERAGRGKVVGGIKEQTRQVLRNLQTKLEAEGSSLEKIVWASWSLRDPSEFETFNHEWVKWFPGETPVGQGTLMPTLQRRAGFRVSIGVIAEA